MSYPFIAIGGLVAQILFTIWLVVISQQDATGAYLYETDSALGAVASGTFFTALLLTIGILIYAIVKASRLRRWGWLIESVLITFAGFFIASGVALIIFGIWAPTTRRERPTRLYARFQHPARESGDS